MANKRLLLTAVLVTMLTGAMFYQSRESGPDRSSNQDLVLVREVR
jgi:hypothetical protein